MPFVFASTWPSRGPSARAVNTSSSVALNTALASRNASARRPMRSGVTACVSTLLLMVGPSLRRLHAAGNLSDLPALPVNVGGKIRWTIDPQSGAAVREACGDGRIGGNGAHVGSYPLLQLRGHVTPAIEADDSVEREFRISRLSGSGYRRHLRGALPAVQHQQPNLPGLDVRQQ